MAGFLSKHGPKHGCMRFDVSGGSINNDEHIDSIGAEKMVPQYVHVEGIPYPIPQYAPTVKGSSVPTRFDPANDCQGYFMSYKYQFNNNCYNYACNIASNSAAQPGRQHGYNGFPHTSESAEQYGEWLRYAAELDGLVYVGKTKDDLRAHAQSRAAKGHYVACLVSPADPTATFKLLKRIASACGVYHVFKEVTSFWTGNVHFVRCDDNDHFDRWSQKDGGDAVTNFDFAGQPIVDPALSNWDVHGGDGHTSLSDSELATSFQFYCCMFVPAGGVEII